MDTFLGLAELNEWPHPDGSDFIVMRYPGGTEFCVIDHPDGKRAVLCGYVAEGLP
jgi:hypothetical protein